MKSEIFWPRLTQAFGNQKIFWTKAELSQAPSIMDRVIHYLISYYDNPAAARNAIRIFRGLTYEQFGCCLFSTWDEVRISSIQEIDDALRQAGCKAETWEIALTIKDFLMNTWHTLDTLDLNDLSHIDSYLVAAYLNQLRAIPNSWSVEGEKETVVVQSPYRPDSLEFYKHFKKYRQLDEPVLPSCAIDFLEYSWNRTQQAPFEYHADRILSRVGLFDAQDSIATKIMKFEEFAGQKPVTKHKNLVQLGKVVCFVKNPRCVVCPVADNCSKVGVS